MKQLSVVVPIYNEAHSLNGNCEKIYKYLKDNLKSFELILVNDGSKDNSAQLARDFSKKKSEVVVISYVKNRGKGYAVKQGVMRSNKKNILFLDADLATPIDELAKLFPYLKKNDVAIGSRAIKGAAIEKKQKWYRILLGRLGNKLIQFILFKGIKDTQCGFKLFKADLAKKVFGLMTVDRWGFDFELLFLCNKLGAKICEVPVNWRDQAHSKIRFSSYLLTLFELLRIKWNNLRGIYKKKNEDGDRNAGL